MPRFIDTTSRRAYLTMNNIELAIRSCCTDRRVRGRLRSQSRSLEPLAIALSIKRRGRIDDQLLVLPPDARQRSELFQRCLRRSKHSALFSSLSNDVMTDLLTPAVGVTPLFVSGELEQLVEDACEFLAAPTAAG